jgi:hypothetical protein
VTSRKQLFLADFLPRWVFIGDLKMSESLQLLAHYDVAVSFGKDRLPK